jgi:hypothetical protein
LIRRFDLDQSSNFRALPLPAAAVCRRTAWLLRNARPQRIATLPACREKEFLALEYCQLLHALPRLYLEAAYTHYV